MSDMNMKTKTQSAWITHVKRFAQENGLKYNEALKDPKLKIGYVKVERVKKESKESKEPMEMKVEPQMKVKKERKKKDMVVVMVEETPMPVVVEELVVAPKKVRVKKDKKM